MEGRKWLLEALCLSAASARVLGAMEPCREGTPTGGCMRGGKGGRDNIISFCSVELRKRRREG